MSQGIHLVSSNTPGYRQSNGRCVLCSRFSGVAAVSSYSYRGDLKPFRPIKFVFVKSPVHVSKRASLVCSANSNSHGRRNPDFSRQNRQNPSFSRNRNRSNVDKENSENLEESETLSSKNGPVVSLSNSPRYQATATPGPREKEIVELFRKVQAQLRERAAMKEEKKIEAASQGQGRESETVDSLLKLLRKHSGDQVKRKGGSSSSSSSSREDHVLDQPEQKSPLDEEHNKSFFNSNNSPLEETQQPNTSPFRRPASNFRRRSPVPRVKYQPIISTGESLDPVSPLNSNARRNNILDEPVHKPEPESELELEAEGEADLEAEVERDLEPYLAPSHVNGEVYDEMSESEFSDADEAFVDKVAETPSSTEHTDLSSLKVSELRLLAKSRGVKGFYKMKKGELLELLRGDSG